MGVLRLRTEKGYIKTVDCFEALGNTRLIRHYNMSSDDIFGILIYHNRLPVRLNALMITFYRAFTVLGAVFLCKRLDLMKSHSFRKPGQQIQP